MLLAAALEATPNPVSPLPYGLMLTAFSLIISLISEVFPENIAVSL